MKIAIVSSRFAEKSGKALDTLRESCLVKLKELGVESEEFRVPGAFEIPTMAKEILSSKKFDAVITLGVIVRGETAHFDLVARNCARKIADLGVEFAQPVILGVLAVDTTKLAEARSGRGTEFAQAAFDLAQELDRI